MFHRVANDLLYFVLLFAFGITQLLVRKIFFFVHTPKQKVFTKIKYYEILVNKYERMYIHDWKSETVFMTGMCLP